LIRAVPALTPSGPAKLFKIDPVNFVVFTAGDCMDAEDRATQEQLPKRGSNTVLN